MGSQPNEHLIFILSRLLSAFIILANVFIIFGILFNRKLHGTINWFFLSLLIADLLAAGALPHVFQKDHVSYSCLARYVVPNFLFLSFLANLLVMHYAKYTCIIQPLHYRQSWVYRWSGLYICLAWVSPLTFASMPLAWYQGNSSQKCSAEQVLTLPYLFVETYVFIIPIIFAIAVMGIRILCIARKQLKNIKKLLNSVNQSQTPSELEQQLELRHAKSIASVSLIFLVCWVPYIVCLNISLHLEIKGNSTLAIVICIGTASAAVIPIILSLGNHQYIEFWSDMAMKAYRTCCQRQGCKQKQNNQPRGNNTEIPTIAD
ncbi:PREDICTED: G-protein coupled bile acid receptor 1 isoform X1 [Thamnophis sirtalis]|uniref:G-protein coupled bile acid receptor 1 n=1 Tax=Thamnophis sirtalis TaxID=35019 RepID=A0A6I9YE21_9SAUR|nr:PREDICTED: G-protein coupled bile acid receptor 1 isoform X1 [Thamnophis sirtalis]XP_013922255.1 PREDICTED: G-protein coupled bile acid receptor 1 isoform X1 [Thamnophis sirtalis]XP_013922256.1 PREDICTED: G-protein coupled bile acid receptor 1 isoform X1 [Thamnophis sirtalis]